MANSIVQRHGGELRLRSDDGKGTVVTLRPPRALADATAVEPAATLAGSTLRILVVDDEQAVREVLRLAGRGRPHGGHGRQRPRVPGPPRRRRRAVDFILAKPYTTEALRSVPAGIQPRQ